MRHRYLHHGPACRRRKLPIPKANALLYRSTTFPAATNIPEVVRFEIEEQDLSSYFRAADFLNISNVDIVCLQHEFGIFGGPAGGTFWRSCAN